MKMLSNVSLLGKRVLSLVYDKCMRWTVDTSASTISVVMMLTFDIVVSMVMLHVHTHTHTFGILNTNRSITIIVHAIPKLRMWHLCYVEHDEAQRPIYLER